MGGPRPARPAGSSVGPQLRPPSSFQSGWTVATPDDGPRAAAFTLRPRARFHSLVSDSNADRVRFANIKIQGGVIVDHSGPWSPRQRASCVVTRLAASASSVPLTAFSEGLGHSTAISAKRGATTSGCGRRWWRGSRVPQTRAWPPRVPPVIAAAPRGQAAMCPHLPGPDPRSEPWQLPTLFTLRRPVAQGDARHLKPCPCAWPRSPAPGAQSEALQGPGRPLSQPRAARPRGPPGALPSSASAPLSPQTSVHLQM